MAVQAELGIVGKIGAELQEKRAEVLVHAVEVMINQGSGLHDPGIAGILLRVVSFLSSIDLAFFLCFGDENDAFPGEGIFARSSAATASLRWPFSKFTMGICSSFTNCSMDCNESPRHRFHGIGRKYPGLSLLPDEP